MNKSIVSDWNGTIYKQVDEKKTYFGIAMAHKKELIKRVTHLSPKAAIKLVDLLKTKSKLEGIYTKIKAGEAEVEEIYQVFNERIMNGMSQYFIHHTIVKMSKIFKTDVDKRILNPFRAIKEQMGIPIGILSVAYEYTIFSILCEVGDEDIFEKSDNPAEEDYQIVGDKLLDLNGNTLDSYGWEHETVSKFALRIYRKKAQFLEDEFARKRDYRNIIYFGDSEDDLNCFDYVTSNNGKVILPFFLLERQNEDKIANFVNLCTSKYNAFIPKDEKDLLKYLDAC